MDNKKLKSSWAAAFTVASVWFGTASRPATRS